MKIEKAIEYCREGLVEVKYGKNPEWVTRSEALKTLIDFAVSFKDIKAYYLGLLPEKKDTFRDDFKECIGYNQAIDTIRKRMEND